LLIMFSTYHEGISANFAEIRFRSAIVPGWVLT
jgi:hypothetical protein